MRLLHLQNGESHYLQQLSFPNLYLDNPKNLITSITIHLLETFERENLLKQVVHLRQES